MFSCRFVRPWTPTAAAGLLLLAGCSTTTMDQQVNRSIAALSHVQTSAQALDSHVLANAQGVAIVEEMQWALAVGGVDGRGLLMRRLPGGQWSAPCAITTSALSLGLSLGGESRSVVFVFDHDEALDRLVSDGNFMVAKAQGTFGSSHGRTAEPAERPDQVRAYVMASGLLVSAALGNMTFRVDDALNHATYGDTVTAWDILDGHVPPPPGVRPLTARLERIAGENSTGVAGTARVSSVPPTPPSATVVETPVETAQQDEPAAPSRRRPVVER